MPVFTDIPPETERADTNPYVVTIFSAPNSLDVYHNRGAMLKYEQQRNCCSITRVLVRGPTRGGGA